MEKQVEELRKRVFKRVYCLLACLFLSILIAAAFSFKVIFLFPALFFGISLITYSFWVNAMVQLGKFPNIFGGEARRNRKAKSSIHLSSPRYSHLGCNVHYRSVHRN